MTSEDTSMDRDELHALTMRAIGAALNLNAREASDALAEIGTRGRAPAIYGACCAFAEVGRTALVKLYGEQVPDLNRGDMWAMHVLDPNKADPYETFAARFIVAYANDDKPQTLALFNASIAAGPDDHVCSVSQLLITAAQLTHTASEA
ncbi:hypothetical protein [Streptomyces fructofermentans]|uniref:Uncharacterized protein n=1 Tax=Streptomyces fructofermentans TaxID=152141 RepID=A0A918NVV2_9ACTN|nr:hypothetical protein [Streptomyces fructofermentans]GGX99096.1 hypothetical protein GCM10010515_76580 [Streptomyces fructofermentans]